MSDSPAARLKALPRFHVVVGYSRGIDGPPDVAEAVLLTDVLATVAPEPTLRGAARMSRPRPNVETRP